MARTVEIGEGYFQVALPNGKILDEGDTTVLSDEQWGMVSPTALSDGVVIDLGGTGAVPAGGAQGDVLTKASAADFDVEWSNPV